MAAPNLQMRDSPAYIAPPEGSFSAGLRSIRHAIETKLKGLGIEDPRLRDTSGRCTHGVPGMVIVDVDANGRNARVTFTRDEVEDSAQRVDVFCVQRKIDRVIDELRR